jgi:hypothetical protein
MKQQEIGGRMADSITSEWLNNHLIILRKQPTYNMFPNDRKQTFRIKPST